MYLSPLREKVHNMKHQARKSEIQEQIIELNKKIHLLEGSKKAYLEKVNYTVDKNGKLILEMREENKRLHRLLNEVLHDDSFVVKKGFQNHKRLRPTFAIYSSTTAITFMEEKLLSNVKRLNAIKGMTDSYKAQISDLETLHSSLVQEAGDLVKMEKDSDKVIRQLENQLDKARLKLLEAKHIRGIYKDILLGLDREGLDYENVLFQLRGKAASNIKELKSMQSMYEDAQSSRDWMKGDVLKRENNLLAKRFQHEDTLDQLHLQEEQDVIYFEKLEKKLKRLLLQETTLFEELKRPRVSVEMRKQQLAGLEERFFVVYKALSISGPKEMVNAFKFQKQARSFLLLLKQNYFVKISQMTGKKASLKKDYESMIYSEKCDSSKWKALVQESRQKLKAIVEEENNAAQKLAKHKVFLAKVKIALTHLVGTVRYFCEGELNKKFETLSDLERLLERFQLKILKLNKEHLDQTQTNLKDLSKGDQYYAQLEKLFLHSNVRVLPPSTRKYVGYDSHDRKHDDVSMPTRLEMKNESLRIVELHMKRRTRFK